LKTGASVPFDYLIVATGSDYSLFGHDEWRPFVHVLKTLDDAMTMRDRLLTAFERAEQMVEPDKARAMLTFTIVGAGPTGVELAGTIAELAKYSLARDFRRVDPRSARIVLIEAGDRILSAFPESLSRSALADLTALGVEVMTGHPVEDVTADHVAMGPSILETDHVFWCAGVQARPSATWIGAHTAKNGAIEVTPDVSVEGQPNLFAIGDVARLAAAGAQPLPGLATVAEQQGTYVGRLIVARLAGSKAPPPFRYKDRGSLAVIGRSKAVGRIGSINLTGFSAWILWSLVHLWTLTGFRNRLSVYLNWSWAWVTHGRGDRIITSDVDLDVG
jgi:NADH dehydrogenase